MILNFLYNSFLFFTLCKHKANTTELHLKVRPTCLLMGFEYVNVYHFNLESSFKTFIIVALLRKYSADISEPFLANNFVISSL